jgi:UDP-N-acetylmuramoyl-tripeptide--D-alanyl-D-alanine ligase
VKTPLVTGVLALGLAVSTAMQGLRWLRVAQREHYIARSVPRFALRWMRQRSQIVMTTSLAVATVALWVCNPRLLVLGATIFGVVSPRGLTVKGRTSPLNWTRRLRTLAAVASLLQAIQWCFVMVVGHHVASVGWLLASASLLLVPWTIDFATRLTAPWERRSAQKFVDAAARRLAAVHPRVIAITGSYGKTSTKHHLAELLGANSGVVPTPRSFNNRAGLSRAINEHLGDDTRVFIAEMGTYGPGEIAELCEWCPPEIAIVTAIGPVHLERMTSLDVIESAKFEITSRAATVVVNSDDSRLAAWVDTLRAAGKRVVTAGTTRDCQVAIVPERERWLIVRDGVVESEVLPVMGVRPSNVACAMELGLSVYDVTTRMTHLTPPQHRLTVVQVPSGLTVIDDTFNANPASSVVAVQTLVDVPVTGRRVVVTPGLVELGVSQVSENEQLGARIRASGCELIVVAQTNASALRRGFGTDTLHVAQRDDAVAWVRKNLGRDDAVLYLNDLPDHYP